MRKRVSRGLATVRRTAGSRAVTLDLENRLWEQLEAAAGREAARGRMARGAAGFRSAIRPQHLRPAAALIAVVAVAVLVVALVPGRARPQWHVERFGVAGAQLGAAVSGHGALWSFDEQSGQVLRFDPRSHRVIARVALPGSITEAALASGRGAVWVVPAAPIRHSSPAPAHPRPATLLRIDPRTNRVVARVVLRAPDGSTLRPVDMVAVAGALWVWGEGGAQRIDPSRNRVAAAIRIPGEKVMGFAATGAPGVGHHRLRPGRGVRRRQRRPARGEPAHRALEPRGPRPDR